MAKTPHDRMGRFQDWGRAGLYALPLAALVIYLFYRWFAVADRYFIFLYYHDMGPYYPDTSPFSQVTSSRYWMAGLVAGGVTCLVYTAVNWLWGRLVHGYRPPVWWRVWAVYALPLLVAIPLITTTTNQPALPALNVIQVTLAVLIGQALALLPGELAASRPFELLLLASDGWGLAFILLSLPGLSLLPRWIQNGSLWHLWLIGGIGVAGFTWLLVMTGLRAWWGTPILPWGAMLVAGLCVAYLLLPLAHHVIGTEGYFYITGKDNFFARSLWLQLATWLAAGGVSLGVTRLRQALARRRA